MELLGHFLDLALESAPWLVLGLILGGLIKNLLPVTFLYKHLSHNNLSSISKATLLGAPLPLCSCGVVPAAVGLRKAGASRPATVSFLISTPETGVDSVSLTYALLGPVMAVARLISALFSAFFSGWLVLLFEKRTLDISPASHEAEALTDTCQSSCCSHASGHVEEKVEDSCCSAAASASCCETTPEKTSCCGEETSQSTSSNVWQKTCDGLHYAFTDMLADILWWLVAGLIFAALVQTYVPSDFLAQWGSGLVAMSMMLVIGVPMYVCATASTPIAVGLIMAGVSPGVALVFLLAGPATNIGTLGIIAKMLGKQTMWLYLLGTVSTALFAGWFLDYILMKSGWELMTSEVHQAHSMPVMLQSAALVLLMLAALRILVRKYQKRG